MLRVQLSGIGHIDSVGVVRPSPPSSPVTSRPRAVSVNAPVLGVSQGETTQSPVPRPAALTCLCLQGWSGHGALPAAADASWDGPHPLTRHATDVRAASRSRCDGRSGHGRREPGPALGSALGRYFRALGDRRFRLGGTSASGNASGDLVALSRRHFSVVPGARTGGGAEPWLQALVSAQASEVGKSVNSLQQKV